MINTGFLATACCDLPAAILESDKITLLPIEIKNSLNQQTYSRSADELRFFYSQALPSVYDSISISEQSFKSIVCDKLIYELDQLLIIAVDQKIDSSLHTIRSSLNEFEHEIKHLREQANIHKPFRIRVIESNQILTGYGMVLHEALRHLNKTPKSADQIKQHIDDIKASIHTYLLHNSNNLERTNNALQLTWLDKQQIKLSHKHAIIGFHSSGAKLKSFVNEKNKYRDYFEYILRQYNASAFEKSIVNISYAGTLQKLRGLDGFPDFHAEIKSAGGKLVHSMMNQAAAIELGQGSISTSFFKH